MSNALTAMQLRNLVSELRELDRKLTYDLQDKAWWAKLLNATHGNWDARSLLNLSNDLEKEFNAFESRLAAAVGSAEVASRSTSTRPPAQITMGKFAPSVGGELAEIRALASRLPTKLKKLREDLDRFGRTAWSDIQSPLRTPPPIGAAPTNRPEAAIAFFEFGRDVVDALVKAKERWLR